MLMRFHWGMAVGHTYTHPKSSENDTGSQPSTQMQSQPTDALTDDHQRTGSAEPMEVDDDTPDFADVGNDTDSDDSGYDRADRSDEDFDRLGLSNDDSPDGNSDGQSGDDDDIYL